MVDSKEDPRHFTTRRAFVTAAGFGMVGLYALWAGYGAAPLGLGGHEEGAAEPADSGHGGGHGLGAGRMSSAEFRRHAEAFIEAHKLPDGSVQPRRLAMRLPDETGDHAGHAGHGQQAGAVREDVTADAPAAREASLEAGVGPIPVYLMAHQWGYAPAVLRLEAGVPYRFRMMAVDVTHGASIQLRGGSRMIRLRPGALVEQELTFTRPGEYLLYCSVYCGLPHDRMQGRIIVAPPDSRT